jgi:hypothetical protein
MRALALAALIASIVLSSGQARAQKYDPAYPVCISISKRGGAGYYDCKFHTMEQCAATASGLAATCSPNPYYTGAKASPKRGRNYR